MTATTSAALDYPTRNRKLLAWVEDIAQKCKPDRIYWCDGSKAEYDRLCADMVRKGTFIKLNEKKQIGRAHV